MAGITRKVWTSVRIYMRLNRWAKSGVPERVFWALQAEGLLGLEVLSLDSTAVKVHPDAHGASK
jgi:hypothetical protein